MSFPLTSLPTEDGQYMAFGLSGASDRSVMEGADAVVAWLDRRSGEGFAEDYYLQSKRQCSAGQGACPDTQLRVSVGPAWGVPGPV